MKKVIFTLLALVASMSINAQVMKIYKGEEVVATYTADEADQVVFEEEAEPTIFDYTYEAIFGSGSNYYYWSQKCNFVEEELWNDGYVDLNVHLFGFASEYYDANLQHWALPCYWDAENEIMSIATFYNIGKILADADVAEKFASKGVKEGDELTLMSYHSSEDLVPFKKVIYNDGTVGFVEVNAAQFQVVVTYGNSLLAYMPAKVSATAFQLATSTEARPMMGMDINKKPSIKDFIPFDEPIELTRPIKTIQK